MKVTQRKVGWGTQATALRLLRHLLQGSGHKPCSVCILVPCHSSLSTAQAGHNCRVDTATGWTLDTLAVGTGRMEARTACGQDTAAGRARAGLTQDTVAVKTRV